MKRFSPSTRCHGIAGMNVKTHKLWLVILAMAAGWTTQSSAVVIQTNVADTSQSFFDANILSNDLINAGQPTLGSFTFTPVSYSFPASGSSDGIASTNQSGTGLTYLGAPPGGVDFLFTLTGSATGYDITSINSIYGWGDTRNIYTDQQWTVSISTVAVPALTLLQTVSYTPYAVNAGGGSSQVTLTGSTGVLASGVTAINFHLSPSVADSGQTGVLREFDVVGFASVPEPSTWAMMIFGLGALIGMQRMRRRSHA